ncbi:MAG: hypothetical protein JSR58_00365 [Verrucomicrobia bacterium]|nr:hypothetical protein [Verrucomicrobiota bacterium]
MSKVQGPSGPTEPGGKKDVSRTDAEKFKKMMEVGEADPEGKGKKRERQQAAEEEKAKAALSGKAPPKEPSPAELQRFQKAPRIKRAGESEKRQKKEQRRPEEVLRETKKAEVAKETKVQFEKKQAEKAEQVAYEGAVAPQPPPPTPAIEAEEEEQALVKQAEEKPRETPRQPAAMPAMPPPLPAAPAITSTPLFLAPTTASSLFFENAEIQQLFERLGLAMTVLHESGITETTVHLSGPEFPTLSGTEIIIRQYSSAPLMFNIEFVGQNLAAVEQNIPQLMNAFQAGNYNFKVHRIEVSRHRRVTKKKEENL